MTIDPVVQHKVARAERVKRALIILTVVLVALVLWRQQATLQAVRDTQQEGSPFLKAISDQQDDIEHAANAAQEGAQASAQLLALVLDCFDPNSKCAKDSDAQRAEQIGALQSAVVAARYCADQVLPADYTLAEITVCVTDIQDGKGRHRP